MTSASDAFNYDVNWAIIRALLAAVKASALGTTQVIHDWAEAMERGDQELATAVDALNQKTLAGVREAVIQAYINSPIINKNNPYRWQGSNKLRRYSAGAMLKTLQTPDLSTVTRSGALIEFQFFNMNILDKGAAQWYRLNFGAKPAKKDRMSAVKEIQANGTGTGVKNNMDNMPPSKSFMVPAAGIGFFSSEARGVNAGFFAPKQLGSGRGEPFYLMTKDVLISKPWDKPWNKKQRYNRWSNLEKQKRYMIRGYMSKTGIRGAGFLDAGIDYFNETYLDELLRIIVDWGNAAAYKQPPSPTPIIPGADGTRYKETGFMPTRRQWLAENPNASRYEWDKYRAWMAGYERSWKGLMEMRNVNRKKIPTRVGSVPAVPRIFRRR